MDYLDEYHTSVTNQPKGAWTASVSIPVDVHIRVVLTVHS